MIFLILDVHYQTDTLLQSEKAKVAGIRFQDIKINDILSQHTTIVNEVAPYESGQFYKREMPCLLALISQIEEPFDVLVIDGYVFLDGISKAGLGKYLYDNLLIRKPIIGIAKNQFKDVSEDYAVWRSTSKHPLYVTSVDFHIMDAKSIVQNLKGLHRLPDIIRKVDFLSRT